MRIFGVDPGSGRTGYGCIETDGTRHHMVGCGAISVPTRALLPDKLRSIHTRVSELIARYQPSSVAVEGPFHAKNARSALTLGQVKGVVLLAASQAGLSVAEYSPTQVKRAVVGYGRAEKHQVQEMVTRLLGLAEPPSPLDVSDALAVAVCHAHLQATETIHQGEAAASFAGPRSWRHYRPAGGER